MPFTSQPNPPAGLIRAYQPIRYELTHTPASNLQPPALRASLVVNTVLTGSDVDLQATATSSTTYAFSADLKALMQGLYDFTEILPPLGGGNVSAAVPAPSASNTNFLKQFGVQVLFRLWDSSGTNNTLQATLIADLSNTIYPIPAQFVAESSGNMAAFCRPTAGDPPMRFLTNKPARRVVALWESEYLYYFAANGGTHVKISVTDNLGVTTTGYIIISPTSNTPRIRRIHAGAENINSTLAPNWVGGTQLFIDETTLKYTVQGVEDTGGGTYAPTTEEIEFYVDHCDYCKRYRLHFVNEYGMFDSISISDGARGYEVQAGSFERTLPAARTLSSFGVQSLNPSAQKTLRFSYQALQSEEFWLQELMRTPLAYLEERGVTRPYAVRVNPDSFTVSDPAGALIVHDFELQFAQIDRSQNI